MSALALAMVFSADVWAVLASTKACFTVSEVVFTPSARCLDNNMVLLKVKGFREDEQREWYLLVLIIVNQYVCFRLNSTLTTLPSWHPAAVAPPGAHHPVSAPRLHPHLKGCERVPWFHQQVAWSGRVRQGWRAPTRGLPLPQYYLDLLHPLREMLIWEVAELTNKTKLRSHMIILC